MMKRVVIAAALAAALAGGSALAIAQQPPQGGPGMHGPRGPHGGPGGPMMNFGLRGLDLSDAQKEQVRTIMDSHKAEFDQIRTRMRDAQRAFADATQADTVDEATIRAKATAVAGVMADEAILRAKVHGEVLQILTADQQDQLKAKREEMQKRRGQGRQQ